MPFKSRAQRAYLEANDPKLAAEFAANTPKGADLPDHVESSSKHRHVPTPPKRPKVHKVQPRRKS